MKNNFIAIGVFVLSLNSLASGGVGNGGDALVCQNYTTLLDSYEAKKRGLTIDLKGETNTPSLRSMVNVAITRLMKKDRYTAKQLFNNSMDMLTDFEQFELFSKETGVYRGNHVFLSPDVVGEIDDSNHRTLPEGCVVKQLVSQLRSSRKYSNLYEFNSTLWNQLSMEDKAMTILHEAWYKILIKDGAKDSIGARYMNGLIASIEFENDSFSDYLQDLMTTEKTEYIIENNSTLIFDNFIKVPLKRINISFNSKEACTPDIKLRTNIKRLFLFTDFHTGLKKINFKNVCFNNTTLKSITLPPKFSGKRINFVIENFLIRTNGKFGDNGIITFNSNGTLKEIKDLKTEALYKMYYKCGKRRTKRLTFKKSSNCKGPYLHKDSAYKKIESTVRFDLLEKPIGYEFPSKVK